MHVCRSFPRISVKRGSSARRQNWIADVHVSQGRKENEHKQLQIHLEVMCGSWLQLSLHKIFHLGRYISDDIMSVLITLCCMLNLGTEEIEGS